MDMSRFFYLDVDRRKVQTGGHDVGSRRALFVLTARFYYASRASQARRQCADSSLSAGHTRSHFVHW